MTRKRNDEHSTEFGLWLREQKALASSLGYVATNIDYLWENYKTGQWLLLEEKRYNSRPTLAQRKQFELLDAACKETPGYCGFYVLTFEKTGPDDGRMWLYRLGEPGGEISKERLISFLQEFTAA